MERVQINIDKREWHAWESVELEWSIDSYSTVTFTAPFEPERSEFRSTFRPFTFKQVEVVVEGEQIFFGWMVGVEPEVTPERRTVKVTAYAMPAVLADVTAPAANLPLEFQNMTLRAIAETLGQPFGIRVHFQAGEGVSVVGIDDDGPPFKKVALDTEQKIQDFLNELAKHRNLVVTNSPNGQVLFWRSVAPGKPVARLKDREQPVTSVTATFSPQEYYSEITGFASAKRGKKGSRHTEKNPFLADVLRPLSFKLDDAERGEAPEATKAKLGKMFANMSAYTVDVATWRDASDQLWQPNTTVTLDAPNAMVYTETELLVRSMTFRQDAHSESSTLGLVLPGAFSGEVPERLPWIE